MHKRISLLLLGLTICTAFRAQAQSTIFTYQGRLAVNGTPATGLFDLQFTIYKVLTSGVPIPPGPITNLAVEVTNGLFITSLDFGNQPFLGVNRWLDIAVRTNGGAGGFTPLVPRVRIASAPYAIAAANVIDGAVTPSSLQPGPGTDGQVLKMSNGVLTWATELSGGTVTSVGTGLGLSGGPITNAGVLSLDPTKVPLLNSNQLFTGSNIFTGVSTLTNASNRFAGAFFGNGAGVTNVTASATNPVTLNGDVTGSAAANTVARIRGVNVLATAPTTNQHLRFSGTDWGPGLVALGSDVSGTLADARLSGNVALLNTNQTFTASNTFNGVITMTNANNRFGGSFSGNGANLTALNAGNVSAGTLADARLSGNVALLNTNQTFTGSNTFSGVSTMTNANNRFVGTFTGNGANLTVLNAANVALGTLADARLSGNVALLNTNQTFTGSNTFSGVSTMTNANNRLAGAFFGNGAGLTNITGSSTNVVTLSGDVIGPAGTNTVARIRGNNVLATAPTAGQHLRYSGTDWGPGPVALGSDVSGVLPLANGGTAANTAAGARASLGAAASGPNVDIISLAGLTTPLTAAQGGTGLSNYTAGDLVFASAINALSRRSIGSAGQVLTVSNALPAWMAANNHNHFGQVWSGVSGTDGLFVENTSSSSGAAAFTASATALSGIQFGVFGQTASANGTGVEGLAYSTNGNSIGVYGESSSPNGTGVYGLGSALSGTNAGVYGESDAPMGIGVQGFVADPTGPCTGVYGESISTNGNGVAGVASSLAGAPVGVYGKSLAFLGIGVYGLGAATNGGIPVGVYGQVNYTNGYGLYTPNRLYVGQAANIVGNLTAGALSAGSFASSGSTLTNLHAGLFSPATNTLACATAGAERLRIAADGKVGVGRVAATNVFEVEGNASKTVAGSWLANSDARIKTSVQKIEHALETIGHLRPVSFHYTAEYRVAHASIEDKQYYNVVAQEFAEVFPEAVKESGETLDGKPLLQVDVHPALITAISAIQELHGLVKAKDAEVARLKEQNNALETRLLSLEKAVANLAR